MLAAAGLEFVDRGTAHVINECPELDLAVRALAPGGLAWPGVEAVGYDGFAEAMRLRIRLDHGAGPRRLRPAPTAIFMGIGQTATHLLALRAASRAGPVAAVPVPVVCL